MNLLKRLGGIFKAEPAMMPSSTFGRFMSAISQIWSPGTGVNYQREIGEIHLNEVILPAVNFKYKAVMSAELQLQQWSEKDGKWVKSTGAQANAALSVFKYSAPGLSFSMLIHRHIIGYDCNGNAYFYKARAQSGKPVALQWLDPKHLNVASDDPAKVMTHWEYSTVNGIQRIPIEDVLHTRFGSDPLNEALGLSPLAGSLRAVYIVNSASNWNASTIKNQGKPSGIVSPKPTTEPGGMVGVVEKVKEYLSQFTADKRGELAFLPLPVDITIPGWKPTDLELLALAKTNREAILSALGVPAEVLSWATDNKSYNNAETAVDSVGKQTIIPMLDDWTEQWSRQLLPELGFDTTLYRFAFNFDTVWWLQDETDKLQDRYTKVFEKGGMTVASYKRKVGEEPLPGEEKLNYFQLQAMARPEAAPIAPKALEAEEPETKAVSTLAAQKDHDRTIKRGRTRLESLVKRLASGDLSEEQFKEEYSNVLLRLHEDLYRIGVRHAGGTPDTAEAKRVAQQVVDFEQQWIAGLVADVVGDLYRDDEGVFDASHGGLQNRLRWYSTKASGTASQAWVNACDPEEEFDWELGGTENHCQDCPYIAANSPYTKDTLYTEPRAFGTPCGGSCDCTLKRRSDGLAGFGPVNW